MAKKSGKTDKSPFLGFTTEEVLASEACSFVIQVGSDFFVHDGMMVFSQKSAVTYYNKILVQVIDVMNNGNKKQKEHAQRVLWGLKILPLRIN